MLFAEGSAAVTGDANQVIKTAVDGLRRAGVRTVEVTGYTDKVAGTPVNDPLSQQRADAVARVVRSLLPGAQVRTSAEGEQNPIAPNDTAQGRQMNRRVAIVAAGGR